MYLMKAIYVYTGVLCADDDNDDDFDDDDSLIHVARN